MQILKKKNFLNSKKSAAVKGKLIKGEAVGSYKKGILKKIFQKVIGIFK